MAKLSEVDKIEKEKRIYQVSLLLRRKPMAFIIEYVMKEWKVEKAQAYRYIKLARKEWQNYFAKLKHDGMSYHIAQIRDLKDKAFTESDTRLVLDITKEEAKLMGIYPAEKHKIEETKEVIINILGEEKEEKGNNDK